MPTAVYRMAVAVACLLAVACGEAGPVTGSFTLSGTVTDGRKAGLAIPGATVRLENGPTTSATTIRSGATGSRAYRAEMSRSASRHRPATGGGPSKSAWAGTQRWISSCPTPGSHRSAAPSG